MDGRTQAIAEAMARVGLALLALPLADLPPVAHVEADDRSNQPRVRLQLSAACEPAAALVAWADALPDTSAQGCEYDNHIHVDVVAVLDGVRVAVWSHFDGEHLVDAGNFLSLPLDGQTHALPLAALRGLAKRRAVSCDA
ncbi:MAG TPA: hypothetical protein VM287_06320 [Egibacteraceae bacterium]|nr:hypothetical protein [Egibacteraceae bacterium]